MTNWRIFYYLTNFYSFQILTFAGKIFENTKQTYQLSKITSVDLNLQLNF